MKPVLILQNMSFDGPAYLAHWLQASGRRFEVRNAGAGESFPADLDGYCAMAVLGGAMSANDPLPSLRQAERLILQAVDRGVPTVGHCLGGQLMARALGARVVASPAPEIGWQPWAAADSPAAAAWFGAAPPAQVFQWHYEAFELPPGAQALAGSAACPLQAFALGPHLAMQFHVEVDADKLGGWTAVEDADHLEALAAHASVQTFEQMHAQAAQRLPAQHALARSVYARWLSFA